VIDKNKELDAIFKTFENENQNKILDNIIDTKSVNSSMLEDTYDALINFLNIEISGLKIGIWVVFIFLTIIISGILWKVIHKVKEHSNKEKFELAENYMSKAGDSGRRILPFSLFLILIFLLFIEASGFSYIFSELMINDASESILHYSMIFGGLVVSTILMFLTHFSGEEIHRNGVLKFIENEIASVNKEIIFKDKNNFKKSQIKLNNSFHDNNANTDVIPQYNRMHQKYFNWDKMKTNRKFYISIFTVIFVLTIGIGAMFVRFYIFDQNIDYYQKSIDGDNSSFNIKTELYEQESKGNTKLKNNNYIPSYYTEQSELRDKYQRSSKIESNKKASYVTYIVMMMLFFGIQMIGIIVGIKYSFIGIESKKAYRDIVSYKEKKV